MKNDLLANVGLALLALVSLAVTSITSLGSCAGPTRGALSKAVIRGVVRSRLDEVGACYRARLAKRPGLGEGSVVVYFVIGPDGRLMDRRDQPGKVRVVASELDDPEVEGCVAETVEALTFPRPRGGGVVAVTFPFRFSR